MWEKCGVDKAMEVVAVMKAKAKTGLDRFEKYGEKCLWIMLLMEVLVLVIKKVQFANFGTLTLLGNWNTNRRA